MRLSFENVGKVAKADIEINSITVIAGANDTGKSTVGKLVHGIYTGLHLFTPDHLISNKVQLFILDFNQLARWVKNDELNEVYSIIGALDAEFGSNIEAHDMKFDELVGDAVLKLKKEIEDEGMSQSNKEKIEKIFQSVLEKTKVSANDIRLKTTWLYDILLSEFSDSLTTEYEIETSTNINFREENGDYVKIDFFSNELNFESSEIQKTRYFRQALYIENPFLLNEFSPERNRTSLGDFSGRHDVILERSLELAKITKKNHFEQSAKRGEIEKIFASVFDGELANAGKGYAYSSKSIKNPLSVAALSTGMKSFSLLKILFDSSHLVKSEVLILDEPEIHLHPEWQLKYAELIVLLACEYNLRVLITSHSPYFVQAIELYSKKHRIADEVRFYRAENKANGMSEIMNVTDHLEKLYEDMAMPFRILTELREEYEDEED